MTASHIRQLEIALQKAKQDVKTLENTCKIIASRIKSHFKDALIIDVGSDFLFCSRERDKSPLPESMEVFRIGLSSLFYDEGILHFHVEHNFDDHTLAPKRSTQVILPIFEEELAKLKYLLDVQQVKVSYSSLK